ncbi:MAG: MarR family transcriptional regulator [Hyphomicrobiales bacterium]|jgi:MarR family transcriptional regulator for hemolysin|nr:MarR family transcriptional regulator [Hyphomicrobiales bacterium]
MAGKSEKSIGRLLILSSRLHRARIGEKLQALSLFPGQEQVLEVLAAEGAMPMGELATRLSVRPPTVSKTIARLSAQGLVQRSTDGGDGRLVRVQLTPEGEVRAQALGGLLDEVEDEMLGELDGKDRKRLRKLLRKTVKALGKAGNRRTEDGDDEPETEDDEN